MGIGSPFGSSSDEKNGSKIKLKFRASCQCSGSSQLLSQDYINNYHQFLSLYNITEVCSPPFRRSKLIIYDTENKKKEKKKIYTPEGLNSGTCLTQLPNGELFCYGKRPKSGIALIIDRNYEVRVLPSGIPCCWSSALYFDNCVYCFGGCKKFISGESNSIFLSSKFDLTKNLWIKLTPIPIADYFCHSVIFNENILISSHLTNKIWLYTIETNSFSTIPYEFIWYSKKILINVKRLYLIAIYENCKLNDGFIYESEDEYNWKKISNSIRGDKYDQIYCLYNKKKIYISMLLLGIPLYYKFNLKKKEMLRFWVKRMDNLTPN